MWCKALVSTTCQEVRRKDAVSYYRIIGCGVCEEWLTLSVFKEWFDANYVDGFFLDKDLLVEGNKVYSPNTCFFVSRALNNLFTDSGNSRGGLPQGVSQFDGSDKYQVRISRYGKRFHLGMYDTIDDARRVYQKEKRIYILVVCGKQRGIDPDTVLDELLKRYT